MRLRLLLFCVFHFTVAIQISAQEWRTWIPDTSSVATIEGRGWPNETGEPYGRFPARARNVVRNEVWQLSRNSAGLLIKFYSSSGQLNVKYVVEGGIAFPHMPATGVSGVDLYGKDRDGNWMWFPGRYSFNDSVSYSFNNLLSKGDTSSRLYEYQLYLPLYNTVKHLELSYPAGRQLIPAGIRREKPIVVYGTSIAQGGCASRPGLAWTAVLERKLDRPLINLGFSGNGRLDSSVVDLISEIDARVFIVDCLPNLTDTSTFNDEEIRRRTIYTVNKLQSARPDVPIVLSEHSAGGDNANINLPQNVYKHVNAVLKKTFDELQKSGRKNIYLLRNEEINFHSDATVDGVHPNDIGMTQNAEAYERLLRKILHEQSGSIPTTRPLSQSRDAFYFMPARHQQILQQNSQNPPDIVFIGNSIVHMWGGEPSSSIVNGKLSWDSLFRPKNTLNLGFGWDRIENVLWRIHHGELDGISPSKIIVMIGTNNIGLNSDSEIISGLNHLYTAIKQRQPNGKLVIVGILPRRATEKRIASLNKKISALAKSFNAIFIDPGKVLLNEKGVTDEGLFVDGLHPNEEGYQRLAREFGKVMR